MIRAARPADADALRTLLALLKFHGDALDVKRIITAATTRREPILVAECGAVVGCLAWHIVPTIRTGTMARITMLAVAPDERKQGIGRALYGAGLVALKKRDVLSIEAKSDIEIRNANGFVRALGLRQASYRFAADI